MRLRLELRHGPQAGAARIADLDRPFMVGTDSGATWQLRGSGPAPEGTATLLCAPDGRPEVRGVGNVTLEGQPVGSNAVPLPHGALLIVAGQSVLILSDAGAERPDSRQDALSINAILSDVAPNVTVGGEMAAGPLSGMGTGVAAGGMTAGGDSPLDAPTKHRPASERFWQETPAFAAPQSPLPGAHSPVLPENWAADLADDTGGLADRSHQAAAALGRVNVNPQPAAPQPVASSGAASAPDPAAGHYEALLFQVLAQIENALSRQLMDIGVILPTRPADAAGQDPAQALMQRRDQIIAMQQALVAACRGTLSSASLWLDPVAISTATAATGGLAGRLAPAVACWKEYQTRFAPADRPAPLSETAFAQHLRAVIGQPDQTAPDQTEDNR